jgi:hypothetical protein
VDAFHLKWKLRMVIRELFSYENNAHLFCIFSGFYEYGHTAEVYILVTMISLINHKSQHCELEV